MKRSKKSHNAIFQSRLDAFCGHEKFAVRQRTGNAPNGYVATRVEYIVSKSLEKYRFANCGLHSLATERQIKGQSTRQVYWMFAASTGKAECDLVRPQNESRTRECTVPVAPMMIILICSFSNLRERKQEKPTRNMKQHSDHVSPPFSETTCQVRGVK